MYIYFKAAAAAEDDDVDIDLFGEETEEEKKAAEERAAAVKASGKKKERIVTRRPSVLQLQQTDKGKQEYAQIAAAAEMILILQGRFSYSAKSLGSDFLLKRADLHKNFKYQMLKDQVVMTSQNSGEVMVSSPYLFGNGY
ncbi:hypothetical protein ACET3Z_005007 [Daucus carota]